MFHTPHAPLRIGTRASPLAVWQARYVGQALQRLHPGLRFELVTTTAVGDQDLKTPLYAMGHQGVFCKEVHQLVYNGLADIGVHSLKDVPTVSPDGLTIAAYCPRHDPRDTLIGASSIAALPQGALIGTSSLRRQHQLSRLRPDLQFGVIRGNVQTRIRKVQEGQFAATLLAEAGLKRLGTTPPLPYAPLHPTKELIPAPAQGIIAVDCLADRQGLKRLLSRLNNRSSAQAAQIERQTLRILEGGCSLPCGVWARRSGAAWLVDAYLFHEGEHRHCQLLGSAATLPQRVAQQLKCPAS